MSQKVEVVVDPDRFGNTTLFSKQLTNTFDGDAGALFNARSEYGVDIGNATFDATGGVAEDQWTLATHNLRTGDLVQFDAVGTGAEPFVVNTDYYAISLTANTFQLASTLANAIAGTPIESVGDADSVGTWSVTVQPQYYGYTATNLTTINRMLVFLEDTTGFQSAEYGNTGGALTNGITVQVVDSTDTVIQTLTDKIPVTTNANWGALCYDAQLLDWSSGNQMLAVRWTFGNHGKPLRLNVGEKIRVYLQDDLSGLISHYFTIQGFEGAG